MIKTLYVRFLLASFWFMTALLPITKLEAEMTCGAATEEALLSAAANAERECAGASSTATTAQAGLRQKVDSRAVRYQSSVKSFGKACIDSLIKGKARTPCKRSKLGRARSAAKKLLKLDLAIRSAAKRELAAAASQTRICKSKEDAATALALYIIQCPPPNPNPPPADLFFPVPADTQDNWWSIVGDGVPLPYPTWLMATWFSWPRDQYVRLTLGTNNTFSLNHIYHCTGSFCVLTDLACHSYGTYTFDGAVLKMDGTQDCVGDYSSGERRTEQSPYAEEWQISLVELEEIVFGDETIPRRKYALGVSNTRFGVYRDTVFAMHLAE